MSKYYIASPFFNEEQENYCESLEELLTKTDNNYYSPRLHGDTKEIDVPEYFNDLKRKLLFRSNIEEIDKCDAIIVNLMHRDMGTLFEFGYACGLKLLGRSMEILTVPKMELKVEPNEIMYGNSIIKELTINITESSNYQEIINEYKRGIVTNNKSSIIVDSTYSGDNYWIASFALGIGSKLGRTSYISPVKSYSNLMITESGIKQYLTREDMKDNKFVVYKDSEIR